MYTLKQIGEMIDVKADVMRDRQRRFGGQFYFGKNDGTYDKCDLIGLAISEVLMSDGHSLFESRRMASWIWHEVVLQVDSSANDRLDFLRIFPKSNSPYKNGELQNLNAPKSFAAFPKNGSPVISSEISSDELKNIFDGSEFLILDLERLAEKLPERVVDEILATSPAK